jgi:putative FmdB family regulatory protein
VPLFDYRCEKGHSVEVLLKAGERGPKSCERCGAALSRQMGAPSAPKVRGGKRRRDIKFRRKGESINLNRKGGS